MKIAVLQPDQIGKNFWMGSRYKYYNLFKQLFEVELFRHSSFGSALKYAPDMYIVFGHLFSSYMFPMNARKPYIVCEFDAYTFRNKTTEAMEEREREKVQKAKGVIVTSPEVGEFLIEKYGVLENNIFYLPLMPSKKELNFEPLPKRSNKTLVYIGGISQTTGVGYTAGHRYIYPHLTKFMAEGWEIHIYPAPGCLVNKYAEAGMFVHPYVSPSKLYQELSQYTAGFQGFNLNMDFLNRENYAYANAARSNKTWEYLAANIPTIGYETGNAGKEYDGRWGVILDDIDEEIYKLDSWMEIIKPQLAYYRNLQVIEQYSDSLKEFIHECSH